MKQMIYRSQPFGFDEAMLAGILTQARRNNRRDGVTGALICRQDLYIQLIEGPDAAIDALFARISVDDRHCGIKLALAAEVSERMFPEWEMLDDTNPTLTWTEEEIAAGAIERASPEDLRAMFRQIAENAATGAGPDKPGG